MPQGSPTPRRFRFVTAVICLAAGGVVPPHIVALQAQEARLRVEENFRTEANGPVLGLLAQGTRVQIVERDGNWTRATIQGYMWMPSLQQRQTSTIHGLVIAAEGGENLRDEPAGRIAGTLANGTVLEELERIPGWVEVRRTGWIWSASLDPVDVAATPATGGGVATSPTPARPPATPPPAAGPSEWVRGTGREAPILSTPDGDTLGIAGRGAELRVVSRDGNWARVQLEGWVWLPSLEPGAEPVAGEPAILTDIRAGELSREYDRVRGRLVEMRLQYISLERAEQVRTDFREGEPFLLTRSLDEDRAFVYVAVPPEQMNAVGSLTPLETIRVVARVRSGAAAFTGSPILDLIELERLR